MSLCVRHRFLDDESGSLLVVVVVALLLLFGIVMVVNDTNKMQTGYLHLQESSDSSVLDAANWISKGRKSSVTKAKDWVPNPDELQEHIKANLMMAFEGNQSYAKVKTETINSSVNVTEQGTDVSLSVCADVIADISGVFGKDKNKNVCVKSVARIYPGSISNKEIVIAYDANAATREVPLKAALLGGDYDPSNPILINHVYGAKGILPAYLKSEQNMKDNNLYMGIVPYTKFVNLYPYGNQFIKNYQGKTNVSYHFNSPAIGSRPTINVSGNPSNVEILRDLSEDYPVFDDDEFNRLLSSPAGYKFESIYSYMRYEADGNGRGKFYNMHPELTPSDGTQTLQEWSPGNTLRAYFPNPPMNDNTHYPNIYLGPYGNETPWMFRTWDFTAPRRAIMDLYETNMVQPLTNNYNALKTSITINKRTDYAAAFEWAYMYLPAFKSFADNSLPSSFTDMYFNEDLQIIGNSARSNGFVGLMTGWTMLSEAFKGRWEEKSVFEGMTGTNPDRDSIPASESESQRDKVIIILMNGFTDDPGTGSTDIVMDNYVQYPSSQDMLNHHLYDVTYGGNELLGQTMFDIVAHPNDATGGGYEAYRAYKSESSASYKKLCDKIKADGIDIYVVNYSACDANRANCAEGFAGKHMQECAGADHYIAGNDGTLNEDIEGIFEGLSGGDRIALIQ
jgi:hypothetical protein